MDGIGKRITENREYEINRELFFKEFKYIVIKIFTDSGRESPML